MKLRKPHTSLLKHSRFLVHCDGAQIKSHCINRLRQTTGKTKIYLEYNTVEVLSKISIQFPTIPHQHRYLLSRWPTLPPPAPRRSEKRPRPRASRRTRRSRTCSHNSRRDQKKRNCIEYLRVFPKKNVKSE